jgi:hypothetical protein
MNFGEVFRPDFLVIALFLNGLGGIIKYRAPKIPNALIPVILLGTSFVMCAVWGYATSQFLGSARWVDSLLVCGVAHGTVMAGIAVLGWDAVFGLWKFGLRKEGQE